MLKLSAILIIFCRPYINKKLLILSNFCLKSRDFVPKLREILCFWLQIAWFCPNSVDLGPNFLEISWLCIDKKSAKSTINCRFSEIFCLISVIFEHILLQIHEIMPILGIKCPKSGQISCTYISKKYLFLASKSMIFSQLCPKIRDFGHNSIENHVFLDKIARFWDIFDVYTSSKISDFWWNCAKNREILWKIQTFCLQIEQFVPNFCQ